jgi:hypothetical protein
MSITFTKLFSSITESTIWAEPDHIRILWITILAMADRKGRVWSSIPGLANRARITIPQVEEGLERFLSPDEYSRTEDNEGRRIAKIDGGWRLLNYDKYRSIQDDESVLHSKRNYINGRRLAENIAEDVVGKKPERFQKPTLEQCRLYAAKIGLVESECDKFFNFYESKGWKVGKNPMVSWPHAMTGWKSRQSNFVNYGQSQSNESTEKLSDAELVRQAQL